MYRSTMFTRYPIPVLLSLAALLLLLSAGCKSKVATNPGQEQPYPWRLELRAPAVMFREHVGTHVLNDTIAVRVYNTAGDPQAGVSVSCWALKSPGTVSAEVQTVADTIANHWGSEPFIYYWGAGDPDSTIPEVITAKAAVRGDTVAIAEARFVVKDPPSLVLICPDTLYRDTSGTVPHDTLKVRAFASDGTILNNVVVHISCTFSPDSITHQATTFADTTARPWGTVNPVTYWGSGPADPSAYEMVTATAAIAGGTVKTTREFKVWTR